MLTINPSSFAAVMNQRSQPQPRPSVNKVTTPQTMPVDTVRFSSSAGQAEADKAYLEKFFQEHPCNSDSSSVLAPQTRAEIAVGKAVQKYMDAIKQGQKPFLPKSYRESLVDAGYLKADNKTWDVERSALRKYLVEVLCKNDSAEELAETLKSAGFKLKSKHKKSGKANSETMQSESPALQPIKEQPESPAAASTVSQPESQESAPVKPTREKWSTGFDWAEEAENARAFVEYAEKEAAKNQPRQGFGDALRFLMTRNAGSKKH